VNKKGGKNVFKKGLIKDQVIIIDNQTMDIW
jgi:hypothetical protein